MTKVEIDWEVLDAILQFGPTKGVCSDILGVSPDTIEARIKEEHGLTFTEYKDKRMGKVKIKLQQKALDMALKGHATMMIFCLKNLCGWVDKVEQSGNADRPISIVIDKQDETL
jgi:hypothetical protein